MDFLCLWSDFPRLALGVTITTGFLLYYLLEAVKFPILACGQGKFKDFLDTNLPILKEKYWPTVWCFESRAQTVLATVLRSALPDLKYRREVISLCDGGEVALDWMDGEACESSPIVLLLPGLTGGSQADYIKALVSRAVKLKVRCIVFNNRGRGGIELKTPRTYCASNTEDLSEVFNHVQNLHSQSPILAVGVSLGGLILSNYLMSNGKKVCSTLVAAMTISAPYNVFKGTESIEKPGLNLLLNHHLADNLCATVRSMREHLDGKGPWNLEEVLQSRTIKDFDTRFTAKVFGFKDVNDYYTQATIHNRLHLIEVPTLFLSAGDDPFQPFEAIPMKEANETPNVAIMMTVRGGHIGFLEGLLPIREHYTDRVFAQYINAVFQNVDYLKSLR